MTSKDLRVVSKFALYGLFTLGLLGIASLQAVIFSKTDDPEHNTTPPSDPAEAKAWHLQGFWKTCQGTPIAAHWFLTAKHIGGNVGDTFMFRGKAYTAIARVLDPHSDLALWGVSEAFPDFAEFYQDGYEVGKRLLVFGRGEQKGKPVLLNSEVRGWEFGQGGGFLRWGENIVDVLADNEELLDEDIGQLIGAGFNREGLPSEAALSPCDSGGGMFLLEDDVWKLAAVTYGAGGEYKRTETGESFIANMLDQGGFFLLQGEDEEEEEIWEFIDDETFDIPSGIWGTRISYRLDWINSIIESFPDPAQSIHLEVSETLNGTYDEMEDWTLTVNPLALKISKPATARFYRIRASSLLNLLPPKVINDGLLIPFVGIPDPKPNN